MFSIEGQLVDVHTRRIYPARIDIKEGRIACITELDFAPERYLMPGFVDAHVHIESSMLPPAEFGRVALAHGTLATVSDPHEIANVLGLEGVRWMLENARHTAMHVHLGAPSCVPATSFETAGAHLGLDETRVMLEDMNLPYLAEMMNWPGVLGRDKEVMGKINLALSLGKPVDGHAPGLMGEDARQYASAGISTDHECYTLDEALGKIALGMKVIIREGSAARNLEALHPLLATHPQWVMLCSDDKHPDELIHGHINKLAERLMGYGYDLFDVLRACSINAIEHYALPIGRLREGDPADFIICQDLKHPVALEVFRNGECVAAKGRTLAPYVRYEGPNQWAAQSFIEADFKLNGAAAKAVIVAEDGQLITKRRDLPKSVNLNELPSGLHFIAVCNRYNPSPPAVALIEGFGSFNGALASSVAHDSHNVVAVSNTRSGLAQVVNAVMEAEGGLALVQPNGDILMLPLPIAGLLSAEPATEVAAQYQLLDAGAKALGCPLRAPFMTLSFMALLVIPELKLSDKGLFDGLRFEFIK